MNLSKSFCEYSGKRTISDNEQSCQTIACECNRIINSWMIELVRFKSDHFINNISLCPLFEGGTVYSVLGTNTFGQSAVLPDHRREYTAE